MLYKVAKFDRLLYGGGTNLHPTTQTAVKFRDLAELYLELVSFQKITFKLGNFTDLKAFFSRIIDGFSQSRPWKGPSIIADYYFIVTKRE